MNVGVCRLHCPGSGGRVWRWAGRLHWGCGSVPELGEGGGSWPEQEKEGTEDS